MYFEYTPEEVRELVAESPVLSYRAATAEDILTVADILEGTEELIAKLQPAARREILGDLAPEIGEDDELWIPVASNCRRSVGVSVSPGGLLSFAVRGESEGLVSYFAARRAAAHALSGRAVVDEAALPVLEGNGPAHAAGLAAASGFASDDPEWSSEEILDDGLDVGGERETGAVDFALKGLAGDEPSDLAADGLAHPAGVSVRYLGNTSEIAAGFAADAGTGDAGGEPGLHPDWRERLETLREGGELPTDLVDDARSLVEEIGSEAGEAQFVGFAPSGFFAELTRRRAAAYLTAEDLNVHSRAERLGAMEPTLVADGVVGRLSTAGRAHLRNISGELLLVPAGASPELVAQAAERSRERKVRERELAGECLLRDTLAPLLEDARAFSLKAVLGRLGGPAHKDFLRRLVGGGELEARKVEGEVVLAVGGAAESVFLRAARLARRVRSESFSNRKAAAARARERGSEAFAAPVVPFGDVANHLPRQAERESGPDPEGSYARRGRCPLEAERSGEAVIGTYGRGVPGPSRSPRQREAARRRVARVVARAKVEARVKARATALACKAAWDAALAIHLASLPATGRLELFLALRGRQEFVVLERSAKDSEGLRRAARELAEAGRVKVRRGRRGEARGKVFLEAAADLDRKELERDLLRVMARAKPDEILVPRGTRLARRVAATRGALTKAALGRAANHRSKTSDLEEAAAKTAA